MRACTRAIGCPTSERSPRQCLSPADLDREGTSADERSPNRSADRATERPTDRRRKVSSREGGSSVRARSAWGSVTIIDGDLLDTPSNVRRVVGSVLADLRASSPPHKVDVVGRHLDQLGLGNPARRVIGDVREEANFRELLDADVVLCCTDTHGSRAIVNDLASTYLLPVIDVGVQAGAKKNAGLAALVAEISVLTPVTPCLWCRKRISGDVIRAENLPPEQRNRLMREGYLAGGVGEPAPSVMALTSLGAGVATCALLGLLSTEGEVCPSGYWVDGLIATPPRHSPPTP